MNRQCFYTTSCANKNIADLPALLERCGAHLVGIRLTVDHASTVQLAELQRLLGLRYRRVAQFGARANKAGDQTIAHLALGLRIVLSWRTNVILLCECEQLEDCHGAIMARELRRQNFAVEELASWQIELTPARVSKTINQETRTSENQNQAISHPKTESAPPRSKTSAPQLESGSVTLRCGAPENVEIRTVGALIAAGLGVHQDAHNSALQAITHLTSGRRICTAETLNQAKAILSRFLRLNVDWGREVPWASEAEAHRLKEKINRILLKANKD